MAAPSPAVSFAHAVGLCILLLFCVVCVYAFFDMWLGTNAASKPIRATSAPSSGVASTALLYAFYEADERLEFLLAHGRLEEFGQVVVTEHSPVGTTLRARLRELGNVLLIGEDNVGFDFGAWSRAVHLVSSNEALRCFLFMNSSVVGPFLSRAYSVLDFHWSELFTARLTDHVKLVGVSINNEYQQEFHRHVQSMLWCTDRVGLSLLQESGVLAADVSATDIEVIIKDYEVRMSQVIRDAGFAIDAIWSVEYLRDESHGDLHLPKCMHSLHAEAPPPDPFDLIFVKENRIPVDFYKRLMDASARSTQPADRGDTRDAAAA